MSLRHALVAFSTIAALSGAASARADPITITANNPLITVNEVGVGSILFAGSLPTPLIGVLAPDPGPGGLAAALTYNLLGPPGLIAGDVFVLDVSSALSDLIRFNPAGTGSPGYPASLVFYSTPGGGQLADTGFPLSDYANTATILEGTFYTPTSTQPGFVPGFSVTYSFVSPDVVPVPEPSTFALLGIGLVGVVRITTQRRRERR